MQGSDEVGGADISLTIEITKGFDIMDIAAMSVMLNQAKVVQQASISVLKMAIDTGKTQMNDIVQIVQENTKMMEQSINPHLGKNIDVNL